MSHFRSERWSQQTCQQCSPSPPRVPDKLNFKLNLNLLSCLNLSLSILRWPLHVGCLKCLSLNIDWCFHSYQRRRRTQRRQNYPTHWQVSLLSLTSNKEDGLAAAFSLTLSLRLWQQKSQDSDRTRTRTLGLTVSGRSTPRWIVVE